MSGSWSSQQAQARLFSDARSSPGGERLGLTTSLYDYCPKDYDENIAHRMKWLRIGASSKQAADSVWQMCASDPLWYINTFGYTFDPRRSATVIPFITYPFQDRAILDILNAIKTGEDVLIEKSRDLGASWIIIYCYEWLWHFSRNMLSFGLVSSKEALVDDPDNPKSLFGKLDFLLKYQPAWLKPPITRTFLHIKNGYTDSTMNGESTTGDSTRSDRTTSTAFDEFASVLNGDKIRAASAAVTKCRIFLSTPKGQGNAFYDIRKEGNTKIIRLHWSQHPLKARGLYTTAEDGSLKILDGERRPGYEYKLGVAGKLRSPYYDEQARKLPPMLLAQEEDIDYLGSDYQFFDSNALDRMARLFARDPVRMGELRFDPLSLRVYRSAPFSEDPLKGRLKIWCQLDSQLRIPASSTKQWVIAADVAMGTGASNSSISFGCRGIPEKIGEIVCPNSTPSDWADLAMALADWLRGDEGDWPEIIHEANGPGRLFTDRLLKKNYARIFWRTKDGRPDGKQTELAGWWSDTSTKLSMLGALERAYRQAMFTVRSQRSIDEARLYVFRQGGVVEHSRSAVADPSGAKENHGDTVISDGLLWYRIGQELEPPAPGDRPIEEGTFAYRQKKRREKERREVERRW